MKSNKEKAQKFLKLVTSGRIDEAYNSFVDQEFIHRNAYYPGDAKSLAKGMKESDSQFPHMTFELKRVFEDGDFVTTHYWVKLSNNLELAAVHIFPFKNNLIVEIWDVAQEIPKNSPKNNGMF